MQFTDLLTEVLVTALGSLAFGIVYKVKRNRLPAVAAGGGIGWMIYRLLFLAMENIFLSNMGATLFATVYSEMLARKKKAPVVVFLLPCLIPLVPGGGIYWTAYYIVTGEMELAAQKGFTAVKVAVAIVLAIVFVFQLPQKLFQVKWRKTDDRNVQERWKR